MTLCRARCDRRARAFGFCHAHYQRWLRGTRGRELFAPLCGGSFHCSLCSRPFTTQRSRTTGVAYCSTTCSSIVSSRKLSRKRGAPRAQVFTHHRRELAAQALRVALGRGFRLVPSRTGLRLVEGPVVSAWATGEGDERVYQVRWYDPAAEVEEDEQEEAA